MQEKSLNLNNAIALQFRSVFFGGNWTSVNMKDTLQDVGWQQATRKQEGMNSIALLVFHTGYYVREVLKVLRGQPLKAHDKYSFDLPPVNSEKEWNELVAETLENALQFADAIEALTEEQLGADFSDPKYGSYYRNLHGIIEHTHYHLGQIALLKKLTAVSSS
jgi:hypothetical protein